VTAIGSASVALAALALVASLVAERRRLTVALWRGRGASLAQVLGSSVVEGGVLAVPAALIGLGLAIAVVPAGSVFLPAALAMIVALFSIALVALAIPANTTGRPDQTIRRPGLGQRPTARRLVLEGTVGLVAIVGVYLLRERSLRGASSNGALTSADPLIAAVPALAGLAAGLLVVRIFPLPVRVLARLSAIRRDLVPTLALRRVMRGGASGPVLVVLLATAAVGMFASAMLVHLDRAAEVAGWQSVGADFQVTRSDSLPLPADSASLLPGVVASAGIYQVRATVPLVGALADVLLVDGTRYEQVASGTPADPHLPASMLGPASAPIPVLVASTLADRTNGITAGSTFTLNIAGTPVGVRAVEMRDRFPTLAFDDPFIIVSRDQLQAVRPGILPDSTVLLLRATGADAAAVGTAVAATIPNGRVAVRAEATARIAGSPLIAAVIEGTAAAAAITAAYAVLAIAAALTLLGAARALETAHLRALGLTRRETLWLTVIEHVPTVLVAFGGGGALGLLLFAQLRPGLGLAALIGSDVEVPLQVDPGHLGLILLGMGLVLGLGLGVATIVARSPVPAQALRSADQ
jgi:putative ABC transport system permease protein